VDEILSGVGTIIVVFGTDDTPDGDVLVRE
jgi:hypothetical protein